MKKLIHCIFNDAHHASFIFREMKSSPPVETSGTNSKEAEAVDSDSMKAADVQKVKEITSSSLMELNTDIQDSIGKQGPLIAKERVAIHDLSSSIAMLQVSKQSLMDNPHEYDRILKLIGEEHPSLLNKTSAVSDLQITKDGLMLTYLDDPEVGYLITTSNKVKIVPIKPVANQEVSTLEGFDITQQRQMDRFLLGVSFRGAELKNFVKELVGFPSTVEGLSKTGSLIVRNEEQADTKIRLRNGTPIKILGLANFSRKVEGISIPYVKIEFINPKDGTLTEGTIAATYISKLQELASKREPILDDNEMES